MKKLLHIFAYLLLVTGANESQAQEIIYEKSDSVFIENTIRKHAFEREQGERMLSIARDFIGAQYVGGTLDTNIEEDLYICCNKVDCTTFVELVTAVAEACRKDGGNFTTTCKKLERLRYRNGTRNGYISRLHYMSWWITDSSKTGIIEEIETPQHTSTQLLTLNFMSRNSDKYPQLKEDSILLQAIADYERPYTNIKTKYIPKELLCNPPSSLDIRNGDIIAIVTAIEGLDVTHVGFATWHGNKLHMLHASSNTGKVIDDPKTLYQYMKGKKNHLGVRVFRAKN